GSGNGAYGGSGNGAYGGNGSFLIGEAEEQRQAFFSVAPLLYKKRSVASVASAVAPSVLSAPALSVLQTHEREQIADVLRDRRLNLDSLARDRMHETDAPCVERLSREGAQCRLQHRISDSCPYWFA